jgi:hypothetical protein
MRHPRHVVSPSKISNTPNSPYYILHAEKMAYLYLSTACLPAACIACSRCTNGGSNVRLSAHKIQIQVGVLATKVASLTKIARLEENYSNSSLLKQKSITNEET